MADGRVLVAGAAGRPRLPGWCRRPIPSSCSGRGPGSSRRGGEKLDAALERFALDVAGRRVLDAGASTGRLRRLPAAAGRRPAVVAIDVGRGQLDPRLRGDPRVLVLEGVNVRTAGPALLGDGGPVDLLTADLSFISLRTVAPAWSAWSATRRRPGRAREAAVRGGPGRSVSRHKGVDPGPRRVAPDARSRSASALELGRNRHHGGHGVADPRVRRATSSSSSTLGRAAAAPRSAGLLADWSSAAVGTRAGEA